MLIGKRSKSVFNLIRLYFNVKIYQFKEFTKALKYYLSLRFLLIDVFFFLFYMFKNPYRMNRQFMQRIGSENVYSYGETPLTTWHKIVKRSKIKKEDHILELGSGRAKTCFWLNNFIGCQSTAVEWNPSFIFYSNIIKTIFRIKNMNLINDNFFNIDYSFASVVYLYGTSLKTDEILKIIDKLKNLKTGSKVITISFSLTDYINSEFELINHFSVSFPWGNTLAYIHKKI